MGFKYSKFQSVFLVLRLVSVWLDPSVQVSWRPTEENLALPHRLQDLIFSALPTKSAKSQLGPVMSFVLSTWRAVEKHCQILLKWHTLSPLLNNVCFVFVFICVSVLCIWIETSIKKLKKKNTLFWLHVPLSRFYDNEWSPTSNSASSSLCTSVP